MKIHALTAQFRKEHNFWIPQAAQEATLGRSPLVLQYECRSLISATTELLEPCQRGTSPSECYGLQQ
jgi:hypothetical protein